MAAAPAIGAASSAVGAAASLYTAYKAGRRPPGPMGGGGGAGYQSPQEDRIGSALNAASTVTSAMQNKNAAPAVPTAPPPAQQPVPQSGQQPNPLVVGNPATNKTQPWQQQQDPYAAIGGNRTIADSLGYRRY